MRTRQQQQAIDGVDDMLAMIEQLTAERDYLDGRCAEFEKLAREFVEVRYPDWICRESFKDLLNRMSETDGE